MDCEDIGIPYGRFVRNGFVFHDLRHCFNTYMRRAGVDQSTIMKITGHSEYGQDIWFRYNGWDLQDFKIAIEKLEVYFVNQNVNQKNLMEMKVSAEGGTRTPTKLRLTRP